MNKFLAKILTEQVAGRVVDESLIGCGEVIGTFAGNYVMRRNVGFKVIESVSGSFQYTRKYYSDILIGKEPKQMHQAVEYDLN